LKYYFSENQEYNNQDLLKELNEKNHKRIKLRKLGLGNFDIPVNSKFTAKLIEETLNKIHEAQKSRAKFIEENVIQNSEIPRKTLTLEEIEQIPFINFCEEIKQETSSDKNPNVSSRDNNINNSTTNMNNNRNNNDNYKNFPNCDEIEKQIKREVELNKNLYNENLNQVRTIMQFQDEDKKNQKRMTSVRNQFETNIDLNRGDNEREDNFSSAAKKKEYVNFVFNFVENIIHENKTKNINFEKIMGV